MIKQSFPLSYKVKFFKRFSCLLSAGIPFIQAFSLMKEREKNAKRKTHLTTIQSHIVQGKTISSSFDIRPYLLDRHLINIVRNAEVSGTLTKSFDLIAYELASVQENRRRIIGLLVYPSITIVCSVLLGVFLYMFVFPQIIPLITANGADIPFYTQFLINSFSFFSKYGLFVFLFLILALGIGIVLYNKMNYMREVIQTMFLRIPFVGMVVRIQKNINFSRTLALFLESGNTLVESLSHIYEYEYHTTFKKEIGKSAEHIKQGKRLSTCLSENIFSRDLIQFIEIGEESGTLAYSLRQVGHIHEEELQHIQKTLFLLIEPALMIMLGVVVGFVALSLVVPMYSLTHV